MSFKKKFVGKTLAQGLPNVFSLENMLIKTFFAIVLEGGHSKAMKLHVLVMETENFKFFSYA